MTSRSVRLGLSPRLSARRAVAAIPGLQRMSDTTAHLRTLADHTTPAYASWTWLAAVRLTGTPGQIMDWGYYGSGPLGTQTGWQVDWSAFGTPNLLTLRWFDGDNDETSAARSDVSVPDLTLAPSLILLAVAKNASGDVTFRAKIGATTTSGLATPGEIAASSPAEERISEMKTAKGAISWALIADEVSDIDFDALPRTLSAPRNYALTSGAYALGRTFAGAEGSAIVDADIQQEGDDAGDYAFGVQTSVSDATKVTT